MSETTDHSLGSAARWSAKTITAWIRWAAGMHCFHHRELAKGRARAVGIEHGPIIAQRST
jgi:hypothetical protein